MRILQIAKALLLIGPGYLWSYHSSAQITISGYVTDQANGEALIGATIYDEVNKVGTAANFYGFYSLTLPEGPVSLRISFVGYEIKRYQNSLNTNQSINFPLALEASQLDEVVVSAESLETEDEVKNTQMSVINLKPKEIENIPAIGGEVDIIKVAQLMPGVSRGGEGTTGLFVRGGTDDQNLILLDEATVYNVGHLFGFFSIFNNDAIRDVSVVKGGFPSYYGGRLSSVMDIRMKEGDLNRWHGNGGIGLLSSRLSIDGPIVKEKLAVMISGRRTYIDQVLNLTGTSLPYYFYDLNGKITYKISDRDRIFLSSYIGKDILDFNETVDESEDEDGVADDVSSVEEELNFGFDLGNVTTTLRWNHLYPSNKMFHNVTLYQTQFQYDIGGNFVDNSILIQSEIRDLGVKADWDYYLNPRNSIRFGTQGIWHIFRPNVVNTSGEISEALSSQSGGTIRNLEGSLYAQNDHKLSDQLAVNYGLRFSSSAVASRFYSALEPRLTGNYTFGQLNSVKLSYTFMRQYMHRVSSSSIALPTDLWYPVTDRVRPQSAHQVAAGYFKGFEKLGLNVSIELYWKTMANLIEYREGARLLLNNNFEEELANGEGKAYGGEILIRKKVGAFTGWVGYTLSRARRKFAALNDGNSFAARFDRRHDLSVVATFDFNERFTFSGVWVMNSGTRFTAQNGQYLFPNPTFTGIELVPVYTSRNAVTLASSHRMDINFIIRNNPEKKFRSEWHIGAYNFYNRASPYRVSIQFDGLNYRYIQRGLFGFIPSVAWNFKF